MASLKFELIKWQKDGKKNIESFILKHINWKNWFENKSNDYHSVLKHLFRWSFHHMRPTVPAGKGAVHTSCVLLVVSPPFLGLHKQTHANHSSRSQTQLLHSAANEVRLWTLGSLNPCLMWVTMRGSSPPQTWNHSRYCVAHTAYRFHCEEKLLQKDVISEVDADFCSTSSNTKAQEELGNTHKTRGLDIISEFSFLGELFFHSHIVPKLWLNFFFILGKKVSKKPKQVQTMKVKVVQCCLDCNILQTIFLCVLQRNECQKC